MSEFKVEELSGVEALTSNGWVPIEYLGGHAEIIGSAQKTKPCGPKMREAAPRKGSSFSVRLLQTLHLM